MVTENCMHCPPALSDCVAGLHGASRRYGTTVALDGVDLTLKPGEILALLGPNGAGKSTAIALLLGLTQPDAGAATLLGGSPLQIRRRRGIGVMMQDVILPYGLRVHELIAQTCSYYPNPLGVAETMALTQTHGLAERVYEKLSGGQKRQVQFAVAVCGRPALLFLDEPTVGLDIAARENLWATVRQLRAAGTSILLTTHYLEEAEALADRVIVLAGGRLVASGTVESMRCLVARRQISCDSQLDTAELLLWPGVVSAQRADQRLTIIATDAEAVLRRLLHADLRVANLEVQRPGLAEAFVELTKEAA
jgi:ABC-type multidrug transport system ATPase subunit